MATNSSWANVDQYLRYRYAELTAVGDIDYGDVSANSDQNTTIYVAGASTANTPCVRIGWGAALPSGVVLAQVRVTATDTVTVTLRNVTASFVSIGVKATRVEVSQY